MKCGTKQKFIVFKIDDCNKFLCDYELKILIEIDDYISEGRKKEENKSTNKYLVINTDEPYANEIIGILKKNGHWG